MRLMFLWTILDSSALERSDYGYLQFVFLILDFRLSWWPLVSSEKRAFGLFGMFELLDDRTTGAHMFHVSLFCFLECENPFVFYKSTPRGFRCASNGFRIRQVSSCWKANTFIDKQSWRPNIRVPKSARNPFNAFLPSFLSYANGLKHMFQQSLSL